MYNNDDNGNNKQATNLISKLPPCQLSKIACVRVLSVIFIAKKCQISYTLKTYLYSLYKL